MFCQIDDCLRMSWVYFWERKSEALLIYQKFKEKVEKESSNFIKVLIMDRGGELTCDDFYGFCENHGIYRE